MGDTSIRVSEELADALYERKERGDTYEDVIWRLLRETENGEQRPTTPDHTTTDDLQGAVEGVDLPGSGAKVQQRRAAVRAALAYISEHGDATPAELQEHIYPDHPAGYDSARSWWKNCVYKALRQVAERDDRLNKADTTGVWSTTER